MKLKNDSLAEKRKALAALMRSAAKDSPTLERDIASLPEDHLDYLTGYYSAPPRCLASLIARQSAPVPRFSHGRGIPFRATPSVAGRETGSRDSFPYPTSVGPQEIALVFRSGVVASTLIL